MAAGRWPPTAGAIERVQSVALAVPLLPGQAEAARVALASCWSGGRKEAYQDGRAGMWLWSTWRPTTWPPRPRSWGTSAEQFDHWFRGHADQVQGIAWDDGFTAPELVLDYGTTSRI